MPRIVLVHPYRPSMAPIEAAFARLWPEAEVLALLDESLYADVTPEGVMAPSVPARIRTLLRHAVDSGAQAVVFTGSTFGPAVDAARADAPVPVLKADEAMAEVAVARKGPILLVCTAARAVPVIEANIRAAAEARQLPVHLSTLVVPEAKAALVAGDKQAHDRLIAEAIAGAPLPATLVLGQISMADVVPLLPEAYAQVALTSPEASVLHLRERFA